MERSAREDIDGVALCEVAAEFMALDGAAIALVSDDETLTPLCSSNDVARALMDLEMTLGEGPTVDASRGDAIVDANLHSTEADNWITYRPEAVALGARAVFGYPVRLGAIRFGALSLFRSSPGPLSAEQASDAYLVASVVGRTILATQAGGSSEDLLGDPDGPSPLDFRVHQAAGMLAVQGSMSVKDALVLLRARAYGEGCRLSTLAEQVVRRTSRFIPETQEWVDAPEGGNDGQ
jgi:hypothetical protein